MEHGASSVVGVDISHKMLEVAKEKTHFPQVEYKCCAIEDVEFPEESFDVILSSLAFHYVADYEILVKKIYRILKSGGKLVFTVEHPVFTAYGIQDWHYNEKGEILHFPVDNYYYEGKRTAMFLGEKVIKYHRSRLKYAAIRSINSADGARSPRSTLLIVFVQNPVAEAISSCRRPRDSRIVFRLLTTAMANTFLHTYLIIPRIQKILSKKKDLIIVDIL